jgi:hypothetical protein
MMLSMAETDYENWRDGLRCGGQEELLSMKEAGGQMPFLT